VNRKRSSLRLVLAVLATAALATMGLATTAIAASAAGATCTPASQAKYKHEFNGPAGTATVWLKDGQNICEPLSQAFLLVSYLTPLPTFSVPQYVHDSDIGTITTSNKTITLNVDVPKCYTKVDLVFKVDGDPINPLVDGGARYNNRKLGSPGAPGSQSSPKPGTPQNAWYNGWGENRDCTQPAADLVSQCNGSGVLNLSNSSPHYATTLTVTLANAQIPGFPKQVPVPKAGSVPVTIPAGAGQITVTGGNHSIAPLSWQQTDECKPRVTVEPDCDELIVKIFNPAGNSAFTASVTYGSETKTVNVAGDKTGTVTFPASSTTAVVTINQARTEVTWQKPESCPTPTVTPSVTPTGPPLAATGASLGGVIGIGASLLAAGMLLIIAFVILRRRRTTTG
jgi:hypothetical protein